MGTRMTLALLVLACMARGALADCAITDPGPAPLAGMQAMGLRSGDAPGGSDERLIYQRPPEELSYWRFDVAKAAISDSDAAAQRALELAQQKIGAQMYNLEIDLQQPGEPQDHAGLTFTVDQFQVSNDDGTMVERLALAHDGLCFHKVIYTVFVPAELMEPDMPAYVDIRFAELMAALEPVIAD